MSETNAAVQGDGRGGAPLTLRQAQALVDRWMQEQGWGYWHPLAQLARMTEELGELARLINHLYGEKPKKADEGEQDLALELADILYTMICLANSQGIDLQDGLEQALEKYRRRDRGRYATAEGAAPGQPAAQQPVPGRPAPGKPAPGVAATAATAEANSSATLRRG
ncbi:MAG TPA: nucleotide pyrophosphohydrolase [Chloroflexota bacterium]|jgi:NTP pyrophosphatase (non-canonical NTP hydrolase)|nr:nucleotide pyrophosphohydrolase [Chloroflexota bacterium]